MKTLINSHIFWKFGLKGNNPILNEPTDLLYGRIQNILKWIPVLFLGFQFVQLFNVHNLSKTKLISPLWPIFPFQEISSSNIVLFLQINIFISLIWLIFKPKSLLIKLYVFSTYFLYVAFSNSFGKIDHSMHLALMLLFCYVLMPSSKIAGYKAKTILMFATAQFFLLLSYSLTGVWKLFWGIIQLIKGEVSIFSPLSFRNTLIVQFQVKPPTVLGSWLIEHYYIGWLAFWVVLYIELFSVYVFFRSNLHKPWGVLLIMLHFGIALVMDIVMFAPPVIIGALLVMSPFYKGTSFEKTLQSFPIISNILHVFRFKAST
ncbi:hypothetical protein FNB79_00605 [Formosa sediminum]|uniref:HTTM domain-containing protein n=1 Tax=Formosa sediminum TaxID=2594004 RepID=A0A516GLZ6_9FLAO|nr:hypothetical protein [Formosa sediminum]QDO92543.1 hypothetical protein FNB79_00605 [Formosa sediminum]